MKKNNKDIQDNQEELNEEIETIEETPQNVASDEHETLMEENKKLKEDYLRLFADTENTKKRLMAEAEKNSKYANSSFAKNLLSVADNLERAMASSEEGSLLEGVKLTYEELLKVFNKFDIYKMDCLGQHFDPNFHQVISEIPDETKEKGTIVNVLQSGYMINDRILREAMVIVSKK